jgi:uncharacterized membrane protein
MGSAWDMTWGRGIILIAAVAGLAAVSRGSDPNDIELWRMALFTFIAFVAITLWNYEAVRNEPRRILIYLMLTVGFAVLLYVSQVLGISHRWMHGL